MICSNCGTDNERGFKFCVKCGSSLENPNEINYEQVDMGGYHSEDEKSGFSIGSGTFTINDTGSGTSGSALYTADELNDTDEEFDFSMYEELAAASEQHEAAQMPPQPAAAPTMPPPQSVVMPQGAPMGMPYMGGQQMMYGQPQIIGYDPTGMPVYAQAPPMMYGQPQIIGYDPTGMPVYAQAAPMMYAQPQIIGYDPTGAPVYAQAPPMPAYGGQMMDPAMAQMQGMPQAQPQTQAPPPPPPPEEESPQEESTTSEDFWKFFGRRKTDRPQQENFSDDDFFSKSTRGAQSTSSPIGFDMSGTRSKKQSSPYMSDTPIVDGSRLEPNDPGRFNRQYMKETERVDASDLVAHETRHTPDQMKVAAEADASKLSAKLDVRSRYSMESAGVADSELEAFVPQHSEALMAQADRAVEALPKKKNPYESELDKIELPEYMKARKTRREDTLEIPSIPQLNEE